MADGCSKTPSLSTIKKLASKSALNHRTQNRGQSACWLQHSPVALNMSSQSAEYVLVWDLLGFVFMSNTYTKTARYFVKRWNVKPGSQQARGGGCFLSTVSFGISNNEDFCLWNKDRVKYTYYVHTKNRWVFFVNIEFYFTFLWMKLFNCLNKSNYWIHIKFFYFIFLLIPITCLLVNNFYKKTYNHTC